MSTRPRVCFIGGTRYRIPLSPTAVGKFSILSEICEAFVVAFGVSKRFQHTRELATFYLLPAWSLPVARYATMALLGPALGVWCVMRHGARIVVVQSPFEGVIGLLVKTLARAFGKPVALITESHGDFEASLFLERRLSAGWLYTWAIPRLASAVLRRSDLGRAVSTSTRAQLQRFAPDLPVVQFATWSDSDVFFSCRRDRTPGATTEILFAGVLIPRKGVDVLIEAFCRVTISCPTARLIIAGRVVNVDYAAGLRAQVAELGLATRVTFAGELDQRELACRMAEASVFVLPTYSEGLPRVVLEAMAVGTPVIATRTSGIPEIITDGVTGLLVEPGNAGELAERLVWVLQHERQAGAMAEAAGRRVTEVFSTQVYRDGYRQMFEVLTNG